MADIAHWFGNSLGVSSRGDLLLADGVEQSNQRIVRRIMTAVEGYVWHLDYGAGIPQQIGEIPDLSYIEALVVAQVYLEEAVKRVPPPVVTVTPILGGAFITIFYFNALNDQPVELRFDVSL